jgi:hypothetical protein
MKEDEQAALMNESRAPVSMRMNLMMMIRIIFCDLFRM